MLKSLDARMASKNPAMGCQVSSDIVFFPPAQGDAMMLTARNDFDFNHGKWVVAHRRLKERGVACQDWLEFETHSDAYLLMDGAVSIDEMEFPASGFRGMSVRLYQPQEDRWAIYWIESRNGMLQPPVYGRFEGGLGVFCGEDRDGDRPVIVRFNWDARDPSLPRWSQAFSYDGGTSWEVNWFMNFRRP
jgi:hypothetical protein